MKPFMQICAVAISATVVIGGSASASSARDLPDLRVLSVFDPPSQLAVGQEFSEEIVVRNVGKAQTQSESKTELYLTRDPQHPTRDVYLGQVSLPKLKAGHESTKNTRVKLPSNTPPSPEYFVLSCADTAKRVHESNENNNCFTSAIPMEVVPAR
jgi:subtilase family serine protease